MEEKSQNPEVQIPNRPPAGEVGRRTSVYVGRRSLGSSATRVADHLGSDTSRLVGHGEVVLRRFRAGTRVVQGACVVDRRSSTATSSSSRLGAKRPSTAIDARGDAPPLGCLPTRRTVADRSSRLAVSASSHRAVVSITRRRPIRRRAIRRQRTTARVPGRGRHARPPRVCRCNPNGYRAFANGGRLVDGDGNCRHAQRGRGAGGGKRSRKGSKGEATAEAK